MSFVLLLQIVQWTCSAMSRLQSNAELIQGAARIVHSQPHVRCASADHYPVQHLSRWIDNSNERVIAGGEVRHSDDMKTLDISVAVEDNAPRFSAVGQVGVCAVALEHK